MKLLDRVLNETTEQGEALSVYIKKAKHTLEEWNEKEVNQWELVFHWKDVPNPNFGYSYYIDTIMDEYWGNKGGLCLNGHTYDYASVSEEVMDRVRAFIQEFVDANDILLEKEKGGEVI